MCSGNSTSCRTCGCTGRCFGPAGPRATGAKWRALGIDDDGSNIFDGLLTRDRIWTVAPPTNHCTDGTNSIVACPANSATYPPS